MEHPLKNKTVVILSGPSGSGKSTLTKKICENECEYCVVSADYFWYRPNGVYDWNYKLIGEAHAWCKSEFDSVLNHYLGYHTIFVDNTNLTLEECKYYIAGGLSAGYNVLIVDMVDVDAEELAKRNIHSVPIATIKKMIAKKESGQSIVDRFLNRIENVRLSATDSVRVMERIKNE